MTIVTELKDWQHRDRVVQAFWSDPAHYLPHSMQPQDPVSLRYYNLSYFKVCEAIDDSTRFNTAESDPSLASNVLISPNLVLLC